MNEKSNQTNSSIATNFVRKPRLISEIGQLQSVPSDCGQFLFWGKGARVLFIGIGPEPEHALAALCAHLQQTDPSKLNISYTEAPDFTRQMPPNWQKKIPASWQKLTVEDSLTSELNKNSIENLPENLPNGLAYTPINYLVASPAGNSKTQYSKLPDISPWLGNPATSCVIIYKPGLKLFPSYFVPLAAQIKATQLGLSNASQTNLKSSARRQPKILLAGTSNGLLVAELVENFKKLNCNLQVIDPQKLESQIPSILATSPPDLFLSINFNGLDPLGEVFYLLKQADVKTATWCVDNPWNLLSFIRGRWWQHMHIFVTDHSFIAPLQAHGAEHVMHLPLATNPQLFCPIKKKENLRQNIVFAGRTEFPNKNKFFAGCKTPEQLLEPALARTKQGEKANFDFWVQSLNINPLWPGKDVREAGFAAETCSLAWRKACVKAALPLSISLYGNPEWQEQLPEVSPHLQPPVDYYSVLPEIYASSQIVLNITSLLLPAGLTQRNFDAWAAGSICLTDKTAGLDIFPADLLEHICYEKPEEIVEKAKLILNNKSLQDELKTIWQKLIINEHSYKQRVEKILHQLNLK